MKKQTPIFWGCTLTHNYPFLIESTKKTLSAAEIEVKEVEGFGCCPDPVYLKAYSEKKHLALSARNLSLAEKEGEKLLVVCNGCYSVLSEAERKLVDPKEKKKVNEELPENREYSGGIHVTHILEELHKKLPLLKTKIKKPLKGLKVGIHYGCHILYPPAAECDMPGKPKSMDEIVKALGAESIEYDSKLDCCGTPAAVYSKKEADTLLKNKLIDLDGKADCLVTTCPACFMRFDMPPAELKTLGLPVFHLSELVCMALGYTPEELYLECHMTAVDSALEKLEEWDGTHHLEEADLSHCGACRKECLAAEVTRDSDKEFDPLKVVEKLKEGRIDEVLSGDEIWMCLQCGRCEERCPQNIGLRELFTKLRGLSMEKHGTSKVIADKVKMLGETGYGMPERKGVRKKMGLGDARKLETEEIKEIIEK